MPQPNALGQMLVGHILSTAALRFENQEALYCAATGRRLTFAQLHVRANQLAHALLGLGLRKGQCVAFLSSNRAEVAEIYFALARSGLVGLPLNYRLAAVEVLALMREVNAVALICERRFAPVAAQVRAHFAQARVHIHVGAVHAVQETQQAQQAAQSTNFHYDYDQNTDYDYETLLSGQPQHEPQVPLAEADPFYFNLTSGTTGVPKCYCINHYTSAAFFSMFHALDVSRRDVLLTVFPMYGRVGLGWLACGLMYGNRNVLANFDAAQTLALIERERVSITNLVATMAALLLASPALEIADVSSLRALVFAGSLLPAPLRQKVQERLCPNLYEYYGMQETGTLVVSNPQDRVRRPESVGRAILFAQVRVVDAQGQDVPPGQTGEVIGRSPNTVTSYHNNPQKTAETFRDGWLYTGDLGHLDADGYLFISGRVKDMIITGGQNVHAGEVEACILRFDGVADCAVIALPDALWGEAVTAVVVPQSGQVLDTDALLQHCRQSLAGFKVPKRVLLQREALPHTPTGKVQKFLLAQRYGAA